MHTPGPWRATPIHGPTTGNIPIVAGKGPPDFVASVLAGDKMQANARLIAAAPKLLEALELAYDAACSPRTETALGNVKAVTYEAIREAKGE